MILLGLLSAFAFLSVSEGARSDYTLTITYNTSSTTGGNTTQQFVIPLMAFSNILTSITNEVNSALQPAQAQPLISIIQQIQDAIPKLVQNPNDMNALNAFSQDLLRLLRGLRNSDSQKLNDSFEDLVRKFLRQPNNGQNPQNPTNPQDPQNPQNPLNPQDPQNPQNPQNPTAASDRAKVSPLINQLSGLASSLSPFISGGDRGTSNLLSDLLDQLEALPNASDIWSAVLNIIMTILSALSNANPALRRILNSILEIALSIVSNLPSIRLTVNGLPGLLVNVLVQMAEQGRIGINVVLRALRNLSGAGRNNLSSIISALNILIEALTSRLPDAITSIIGTLTSQLTQYGSGNIGPQSIIDTLQQLVGAVLNDPNAAQYKSLIAIIVNAIGLLLGDIDGIGTIIQRLMALLNVRVDVNGSDGCPGLIGTLLCTVSQLLGGLLGGSSGRNVQQLANAAGSGLGSAVGGAANGLRSALSGGGRGSNIGSSSGGGGGGGGLVGSLLNLLLGK